MEVGTRGILLLTAERLFAERGVDGVSVREISTIAGVRNMAAVHYHFGGKGGLIDAIYEHRVPEIDARRRARLDSAERAGDELGIRALVEIFALPLIELSAEPGNHYAGFQAKHHYRGPRRDHPWVRLDPEMTSISRRLLQMIDESLPKHLPVVLRHRRVLRMSTLLNDAIAEQSERASEAAPVSVVFDEVFVTDLIDTLVGVLASPSTVAPELISPELFTKDSHSFF